MRITTSLLFLLTLAALGCASAPDLLVDGDDVLLKTDDLDVRMSVVAPLDESYMLFGGTHVRGANAIGSVMLAGLPAGEAGAIYREHPDFHRCNSAGAPLAKRSIVDLQLVPADGKTLSTLRTALSDFGESLRKGGDRVCVSISGSKLNVESIVVREAGESITDSYPISTFYLVESASPVNCKSAMADS